jgi:uncharacterized protein (DUF1697 family)
MTICIALLRGINVSGQKAIRMAGLQASLSALGLADPHLSSKRECGVQGGQG